MIKVCERKQERRKSILKEIETLEFNITQSYKTQKKILKDKIELKEYELKIWKNLNSLQQKIIQVKKDSNNHEYTYITQKEYTPQKRHKFITAQKYRQTTLKNLENETRQKVVQITELEKLHKKLCNERRKNEKLIRQKRQLSKKKQLEASKINRQISELNKTKIGC
jgi:hypothetical protein